MNGKQKTMIVLTVVASGICHSIARRPVATLKQSGYRAMQISLFALVALTGALAISVSAQQSDPIRPADINRLRALGKPIDINKLRSMGKPALLSPAEKLIRLKKESSTSVGAKSKTLWKPVFRLTPRNSYFAPTSSYWYFNQPAFFSPHWYDDEGAALFVSTAPDQMVLRFNGQPNTTYGIDITLGIGGDQGFNTFKVGYVADGATPLAADGTTPLSPNLFKVGGGPYEHLIFDLVTSKSGEYIVVVNCTQMTSWWYFKSLEVGVLQ